MEVQIFTAIANAGSFGLLVYIAVWGLPKLLTDAREEREKLTEACRQEREAAINKFAEQLDKERAECSDRFDKVILKLSPAKS